MNHTHSAHFDSMRDHERSEIISESIQATAEKVREGKIAGFPWQLVMVMAVIALGMLVVGLKGTGVF